MMSLNSLYEWRILQGIGSGVIDRLARCKATGEGPSALGFDSDFANNNNLEFLETELRQIFRHQQVSTDYGLHFGKLQASFTKLCVLLEGAVNLPLIVSRNAGVTAQERVEKTTYAEAYPNLQALLCYLNDEAGQAQPYDLDLVHGPNPTIFKIVGGLEVKEALSAAEDCNELLIQPRGSAPGVSHLTLPPSQAAPTTSSLRERADEVLNALFAKFSHCRAAHEVLLRLAEGAEVAQPQSALDMFLPCCSDPEPERWREAQCLPLDCRFLVEEVRSICNSLQKCDKGKIFSFLVKHHGVFGIREFAPPMSHLSPASIQPLNRFIKRGAFLRDDLTQSRPSDFFTLAEKQAIALGLARCLVDFFDSTSVSPAWNLGKVYLVAPPERKADEIRIYVTFERRNQRSFDTMVDIGNPVLLGFAKLLLEIDSGSEITLSGNGSNPQHNWADLCVELTKADRYGNGMYLSAIKECLYIHYNIPKNGDLQARLRKYLCERVVAPLEAAVSSPSSQATRAGRGTLPLRETVKKPTDNAPKASRMAVFRASEVTIRGQDTVSDIVHRIIAKNITNQQEMALVPDIKDITPLLTTKTAIRPTRRGTALIIFSGPVPNLFRDIMHANIARVLTDKTGKVNISMDVDAKFVGMTQLHEPPPGVKHEADIIAIHGLNGHPYGSWLSKSDSPQMWLQDFLPEDAPNCRIFIYGYESNIFGERTHPRFDLAEQAENLIQALDGVRNTHKLQKKPIIFIAHSFGGLVLARALVKACSGPSTKPLYGSTIGLFLFACPLRGFHVQDILDAMEADWQATGQGPITGDKAKALVQRLGEGNFRNELDSLPDILRGKKVYTFVEQRQTPMVMRGTGTLRRDGEPVMAAGPHSVILGLGSDMEEVIGANKDHSSIVKFDMRSDETYQKVKKRIQDLVTPDPALRWPFGGAFRLSRWRDGK